MDVISSPPGNGSNGVIGIPLRLLLNFHEKSVADFCQIVRVSPKSFKSRHSTDLDTPHHHPPRIDTEVKERVLSIRQAPPEPLQRTPGPLAILYYLQRDEALQAKKARLPRSTRTIWRILDAAEAIERDRPHQRSPRLPRAPLEEVQLDFKDVSTVPADLHDPDAKRQHVIEACNAVRRRHLHPARRPDP